MLCIYIFLVFLLSYYIYKNAYKYYINPQTNEKILVQSLYEEFTPNDKLSFIRIFLGYLTFAIPKLLINVFFASMLKVKLSRFMKTLKNLSCNLEEWKLVSEDISFWPKILLKLKWNKNYKNSITI